MFVLGFRLSLDSCVYPSLSASEGPSAYSCGSGLWCTRGHSPHQKISSVDLYIWCYNSVHKEGHEKCRSLLVSRKGGALSTTVALNHFKLWCSGIDSAEETVVSVRVRHLVKADCMAVFGGGGCPVFSLEPLAQDPKESEITDMRNVNLFTPLPLSCSTLTEDWKFLVAITLVWSSEEYTLQKFGLGLVSKFSFGVYSGEAKGSVLAPCVTFVWVWSFHVLLRDRNIFFVIARIQP
jgi:hypothetical protein